jgi:hypothetical protein
MDFLAHITEFEFPFGLTLFMAGIVVGFGLAYGVLRRFSGDGRKR